MRREFLPFSKPSISDEEIKAVGEVLRSGWITTGPKSAEFEQRFAAYLGLSKGGAIALSSATAGMHVALKALGVGPGDEVITPSMTWVSTANQIVLAGATPVFADIERDTLMITPDSVAPKITAKTKVIIPVHYAGAAADLAGFRKLADEHGIILLEDAAHAIGTACDGERVGQTGTTLFSFHPIKNMTTGEGGMLCSDDEQLLERVRRLKFHGLGVDAFDRQTQGRAPQAEVQEPGYKYNITDIASVLGLSQLARVDGFNRERAELATLYQERLAEIDELLPLETSASTTTHAWNLFIVRLDIDRSRLDRDAFMQALKERNIGTGLHFRATHLQKYYREVMGFTRGLLQETEWNSDRILSIPFFPGMTPDDLDDVVCSMKDVLKR